MELGGFAYGMGEVSVATTDTSDLPDINPTSDVIARKFLAHVPATYTSGVQADVSFEKLKIADLDLTIPIGTDISGCCSVLFRDSVINPMFDVFIKASTKVTAQFGNSDATTAVLVSGGFTTDPGDAVSVEEVQKKPRAKRARSRLVHLGHTTATTGTLYSGKIDFDGWLKLLHLCLQPENDDCLVDELKLWDKDLLTGGTIPSDLFLRDCAWFGYRGARVNDSAKIRVSTTSMTSGSLAGSITATVG